MIRELMVYTLKASGFEAKGFLPDAETACGSSVTVLPGAAETFPAGCLHSGSQKPSQDCDIFPDEVVIGRISCYNSERRRMMTDLKAAGTGDPIRT